MKIVFFIYCFLFSVFSFSVQAGVYKWVDKDGRVHYGDKPPLENKANKEMTINEKSNAVRGLSHDRLEKRKKLLGAIDEDRKLKKEADVKAKKKKEKLSRQCHTAKDALKNYQQSSYVYDLDKDGNRVVLPSTARDGIISRLQKQIAKNCK